MRLGSTTCIGLIALLAAGCESPPSSGTPEPTQAFTASEAPETQAPTATAPQATPPPGSEATEPAAIATPTVPPHVTSPPQATDAPPAPATPIAVDVGQPGDIPLIPPDPAPEPNPRARHRMDIDQLNMTIRRVTGGIGWTETQSDGTQTDLFEELSLTLGKPDYIDTTQEDLAPSLLFQKFLGDASRSVCRRLVEREMTQPAEQRVLMVHIAPDQDPLAHPELTQANLSMLLLRFHGHTIKPGSEALNPWAWLVESTMHVTEGQDPSKAWEAVCVGLMTHPDFYSY